MIITGGDEQNSLVVEGESVGREARPRLQQFAFAVKDLDAVVFPIAHEDSPLRVHDDRVRQVEFSGSLARRAPRLDEPAFRRKLHHASIAIAVRHVELPIGTERDIGRLVELVIFHPRRSRTQCQQQLAGRIELKDPVPSDVGRPDVVISIDSQAMSGLDQVVTPGSQEFAVRIKTEDRMFAAMKHIDLPLAADCHRRTVSQRPTIGQF